MPNNFTGDPDVVALYNLEGAGFLADSIGINNLSNVGVQEDVVNFKQGSGSAFADAGTDRMSRSDAVLSADFPGKQGTANRTLSVCFWARPTDIANFSWPVGKWEGGKFNWLVKIEPTVSNRVYFHMGYAGGVSVESFGHAGVSLVDTQWYHFGITYDSITKARRIRIWDVDASTVTESTGIGTETMNVSTNAPFQIYVDVINESMKGNMDEVVLWKRAISAAEIDATRNGTFPLMESSIPVISHHYTKNIGAN